MRVIYVDDESPVIDNFRLTVEGLPQIDTLHFFKKSEEALKWAEENQVDVAFLDIEMPVINGIELAKCLKQVYRNIEAIIEVVGIRGLAEKYGIVSEQPRSDFAKYNDNGPIPEKVADLCVSHIKQGFRQFQSGEYALETKDYLVMCRIPWKGWEKIDAKDDVQNYGFFGIEKCSGKVTRINIDYKKDFPFAAVENLPFCIQENTIYFMENGVDREKRSEVQLVSIDFAKKEFQKEPFKFSISGYDKHIYNIIFS